MDNDYKRVSYDFTSPADETLELGQTLSFEIDFHLNNIVLQCRYHYTFIFRLLIPISIYSYVCDKERCEKDCLVI